MAFPTLNMLSYWFMWPAFFFFGASFFVEGGAASGGWTSYPTLSTNPASSPASGMGQTMWLLGLTMVGVSSMLGSVNYMTTIILMRAPGMTMFRLPMTIWAMFITAVLQAFALPVLTAAGFMQLSDRMLGTGFFSPEGNVVNNAIAGAGGGQPLLVDCQMGLHLTFGVHHETHARGVTQPPSRQADGEGPGVPHRVQQAGPVAQVAQARLRPRQVVGLLARRLQHLLPHPRAASREGLRLVQGLGTDLTDMVDAHQRAGKTAVGLTQRRRPWGIGGGQRARGDAGTRQGAQRVLHADKDRVWAGCHGLLSIRPSPWPEVCFRSKFTLATAVASRCAQATGWPYFRMGTLQGADGSGRILEDSRNEAV
jgi:hypothetical protein